MGYYQVGQVCLNGHAITSNYEGSPELRAAYCSDCGKPTIHKCQKCQTNIRGWYDVEGFISFRTWDPPAYCHACGDPYPWTASALEAARQLASDADALSDAERSKLQTSITELAEGGPLAEAAGVRFRSLVNKAGPTVGAAMKQILVSVLSEAAKRAAGF